MRATLFALSVSALTVVTSCSSNSGAPPAAQSGGGKKVDAATAAKISGVAKLDGTPPPAPPLKMGADPVCEAAAGSNARNDAVLVASDGAIQNVFVYVKDGLDPSYSFDAPSGPLVFDQRGCRYLPRVFGIRVGQSLDVVNDDATMHNVHALPKENQEFNH